MHARAESQSPSDRPILGNVTAPSGAASSGNWTAPSGAASSNENPSDARFRRVHSEGLHPLAFVASISSDGMIPGYTVHNTADGRFYPTIPSASAEDPNTDEGRTWRASLQAAAASSPSYRETVLQSIHDTVGQDLARVAEPWEQRGAVVDPGSYRALLGPRYIERLENQIADFATRGIFLRRTELGIAQQEEGDESEQERPPSTISAGTTASSMPALNHQGQQPVDMLQLDEDDTTMGTWTTSASDGGPSPPGPSPNTWVDSSPEEMLDSSVEDPILPPGLNNVTVAHSTMEAEILAQSAAEALTGDFPFWDPATYSDGITRARSSQG